MITYDELMKQIKDADNEYYDQKISLHLKKAMKYITYLPTSLYIPREENIEISDVIDYLYKHGFVNFNVEIDKRGFCGEEKINITIRKNL